MFSFRPIDLSIDTETIIKYRKDSYKVNFGDENMFGNKEEYLNKIKERLLRFPEGLVIVEKDGLPIGQVELQIKSIENKDIGYVNLFYLTPEYREKGYGLILIDYAESFFKKHKLKEYQLRVSTTNQRAISFYKKNGFNLLCIEEKNKVPRYRMGKCLV